MYFYTNIFRIDCKNKFRIDCFLFWGNFVNEFGHTGLEQNEGEYMMTEFGELFF